ncbi:glycosyltransferase family 2 protein [Dysgonomonas reticulitermitis]
MKVSVITINYNNAAGLEKTIKSVLSQSYQDFEYIVIDGGSADRSREILESYSEEIDYWISEPDNGIYNAMNKGIRQATGQYLHFLNSGDTYASDNVLENVFRNKEYKDPILRGIQICDCGTHQFRWYNHGLEDITLYHLYVDTLQHQATFINATLFKKYGLYDEKYRIGSDWKFFIQAILGGESSFYLNIDIVIFDMTGISNNPKYKKLMYEERALIMDELIPKTIQRNYDRLISLDKQMREDAPYYYVINFVKRNRFPYFCIRVLNKIYKILGLNR